MATNDMNLNLGTQNFNTHNVNTQNRTEALHKKESAGTPSPTQDSPINPKDVLTISEDGNIDYALFNYLDKGGAPSDALNIGPQSERNGKERTEETDNTEFEQDRRSFAVKPDFRNISASRYNQLKAEIEQAFADDPASKSKYLSELDKALEDYEKLQEQLNSENVRAETNKQTEELLEVSNLDAKKTAADKIFGKTDNDYSPETSKVIDDLLMKVSGIKKDGDVKPAGQDPGAKDPLGAINPSLNGKLSL